MRLKNFWGSSDTVTYQPLESGAEDSDRSRSGRQFKRTFLEQTLIVLSLALLLVTTVFVALFIRASNRDGSFRKSDRICTTPDCVLAAATIIQNMDDSVDPCDDFYKFSCNGWQTRNDIPAHKVRIGIFDQVYESNVRLLRSLLSEPPKAGSPPSRTDQTLVKLHDLYSGCMNTSYIDELSASPLVPLIQSINHTFPPQLPKSRNTVGGFEEFQQKLGEVFVKSHLMDVNVLLAVGVESDAKDPDFQTVYLSQAPLGLPSKEYYEERDVLAVYERTIEKMFSIVFKSFLESTDSLSVNVPYAGIWASLARNVVDFESKLAKISWSNERLSDPIATYNPYNLTQLSSLISFLPIEASLSEILKKTTGMSLRDLNYPFIVATPSYFEELGPILAKTDNQVLNAYFIWHLILNYVDVLGESVKKGMDEYKEKVLGISPTSLPPRYETCLKYVDKLLGFAAGKFFIDKKFGGESKNVAEGMIQGVIDAFIARINALEWLDEKTSVAAIEKMTALIQKIGFPDFVTSPEKLWDYYAELNIIQSDFFGNVYRHNYVNVKRDWNKLSKKTDKQKWEMFPQTVNAYYNPLVNEIVFPAGILQTPFFNAEVPGYLNYGGIGLVMGHEASHGVDNMGRHYDSKGRLRDWWSPHTNAEFEKRSQCFIEQYSGYYINDAEGRKVHVNGKLTLGENLADNGGLRQSWTAWKNSTSIQHKKETKLPGLLSYSPEQLFFVNFAQVWCSKYKPQYALQSIRVDPHSPPFVRVNAAVQNSPDFARVFNCPAKSPMNPEKKCSIW